MSTSSPWSARASRPVSRRSAPRSPRTSSRCCGRWRTSRSCVSTATRPGRRRRGAPPTWRCRICCPGKSLRFALLPEGQDPDDLARSGGRAAIEEVIGAARGLADVIWSREIEGGSFATPERRAALEKRIGELQTASVTRWCGVYYRQDLAERLQRTFAPETGRGVYARADYRGGAGESGRRFASRGSFTPGAAGRSEPRGGRSQASAGSQTINRGPYQAASSQLAASPTCAASAARCRAGRR